MSRCTPECIPKGAAALGCQIRSRISLKIGLERNNFSLIKADSFKNIKDKFLTLNVCEVFNMGVRRKLKFYTKRYFTKIKLIQQI